MNDDDSLQNQVNKTQVNRFGGYYVRGKSYSPERIAECADMCHKFIEHNGKEPTISEFMEVSKIGGRDFALRIINHCKHGVKLKYLKQGHRHLGPLSRIECHNEGLSLYLCVLYLDWPSRTIMSYKYHIKQMRGVDISEGTISAWFRKKKFCTKVCLLIINVHLVT